MGREKSLTAAVRAVLGWAGSGLGAEAGLGWVRKGKKNATAAVKAAFGWVGSGWEKSITAAVRAVGLDWLGRAALGGEKDLPAAARAAQAI